MDKAKILRLFDEADDIVSALYRQGANKNYKCKSLHEKLKAIAAEITAPPKSNGDRIRAMTDEELAKILCFADCEVLCPANHEHCNGDCCGHFLRWLKQEVSGDAGKTD